MSSNLTSNEMSSTSAIVEPPEAVKGNERDKSTRRSTSQVVRPEKHEVENALEDQCSSSSLPKEAQYYAKLDKKLEGKDPRSQFYEAVRLSADIFAHKFEKAVCSRQTFEPTNSIIKVLNTAEEEMLHEKVVPLPVSSKLQYYLNRGRYDTIFDRDEQLQRTADPMADEPDHVEKRVTSILEQASREMEEGEVEPVFYDGSDEDQELPIDLGAMRNLQRTNKFAARSSRMAARRGGRPGYRGAFRGAARGAPSRRPAPAAEVAPETPVAAPMAPAAPAAPATPEAAPAAEVMDTSIATEMPQESAVDLSNVSAATEMDTSKEGEASRPTSEKKKKIRTTEMDRLMSMDLGPKDGGRVGELGHMWPESRRRPAAPLPETPAAQPRKSLPRRAAEKKKPEDSDAAEEQEVEMEVDNDASTSTPRNARGGRGGGNRRGSRRGQKRTSGGSGKLVEPKKEPVDEPAEKIPKRSEAAPEVPATATTKEAPPSTSSSPPDAPATPATPASSDSRDSPRKIRAMIFSLTGSPPESETPPVLQQEQVISTAAPTAGRHPNIIQQVPHINRIPPQPLRRLTAPQAPPASQPEEPPVQQTVPVVKVELASAPAPIVRDPQSTEPVPPAMPTLVENNHEATLILPPNKTSDYTRWNVSFLRLRLRLRLRCRLRLRRRLRLWFGLRFQLKHRLRLKFRFRSRLRLRLSIRHRLALGSLSLSGLGSGLSIGSGLVSGLA
nr:hypothetical protein C50E10.4 - Caenorhabditis elegans [Caenorhabditis elegans]